MTAIAAKSEIRDVMPIVLLPFLLLWAQYFQAADIDKGIKNYF